MTRLRFLLLSFFSSVASVFAMKPDREALARAWLETNGFVVEQNIFSNLTGERYFYALVYFPAARCAGARQCRSMLPKTTPALDYLRWLDTRGFVIEEKRVRFEMVSSEQQPDNEWNIDFIEVEEAPPTIHRFTRPEWL